MAEKVVDPVRGRFYLSGNDGHTLWIYIFNSSPALIWAMIS